MSEVLWREVDRYLCESLVPSDPVLDAVLEASERAGLPAHNVAPNQGKLLMLLAQLQRARRILEIGTLGGYSTIWLARALPNDGQLDTLEVDPGHAAVARQNIARASLEERVQLHEGPALETLARFAEARNEAYDLIFIDADKPSNPDYLRWSLELTRPGSLIVVDNVIRDGEITNTSSDDPRVQGVRRMIKMISREPRLSATAIQTVGSKGYDGFALLRVVAP
ncbi:MAG: O-methyltransferase [Deltaproteobacteria bacterium]|nr:O-methyltransferase [Deltaproteobacteria bacterium]MBW2388134.1 O-methyltransferase [Deltaproteobacteria bacterium]MBW2724845.1 O-methyltransferase [Deltaproteobacteria bacterium]